MAAFCKQQISAKAFVASGHVDARTVYLDPNNTLSYKYLVSQSLGGDSPPFLPRALARRAAGKLEGGRNPKNGQILEGFSSLSLQASQDSTT